MGRILLKKITTTKRIIRNANKNSNATIVKDKNGKLHCSKCGAFITK